MEVGHGQGMGRGEGKGPCWKAWGPAGGKLAEVESSWKARVQLEGMGSCWKAWGPAGKHGVLLATWRWRDRGPAGGLGVLL